VNAHAEPVIMCRNDAAIVARHVLTLPSGFLDGNVGRPTTDLECRPWGARLVALQERAASRGASRRTPIR